MSLTKVRLLIILAGLLIGCGKKGKFCGIFKGNYAAKKVHYAANYAIFLKLILINIVLLGLRGGKPFLLSIRQLERKRTIKAPTINHFLPHFNHFNLKWVI